MRTVKISRGFRAGIPAALLFSLALTSPEVGCAEELPAWFPRTQSFSVNPDNTIHEDYGRALIDLGTGGSATQS